MYLCALDFNKKYTAGVRTCLTRTYLTKYGLFATTTRTCVGCIKQPKFVLVTPNNQNLCWLHKTTHPLVDAWCLLALPDRQHESNKGEGLN